MKEEMKAELIKRCKELGELDSTFKKEDVANLKEFLKASGKSLRPK